MLRVVMYHYVRAATDLYPRLKGIALDDFCRQVDELAESFEMASLESALDYIAGRYSPNRDLCLLTFDDGLKDHARAAEILGERRIEGQFFLITSAIEEQRVLSVHKNHLLLAALDFEPYRAAFLEKLVARGAARPPADPAAVKKTYRWDTEDVATFKYLLNFQLDKHVREQILDELFLAHVGQDREIASSFYLSWDEARHMQQLGMRLGGHTHRHEPLSTLSVAEQRDDLTACSALLAGRLLPQKLLPFSYPYGKSDSFTAETQRLLREAGFACAFTTQVGDNLPGQSPMELRRVDTKDCQKTDNARAASSPLHRNS
jgi:peptidoglycan/xylan/chitin deacetylase (PgdA/CDA1 family)